MSVPGFYNDNLNRAYPLRDAIGAEPGTGALDAILVDAGFVLGTAVDYDLEADEIRLTSVVRSGTSFTYNFIGVGAYTLSFTFDTDDGDFQTLWESLPENNPADTCPDEFIWEGFIVTGSADGILEAYPSDGTVNYNNAILEQARIQSLAGTYIDTFNIANRDRTRVTAAADCDELSWPFETGILFPGQVCLQGSIVLQAGYNAIVRQDTDTNTLEIGAAVGAGMGSPCAQVPVFADEASQVQMVQPQYAPEGLETLDGALRCNNVVRSLNGAGGRLLDIFSSRGATITPVPAEHKVIVDVDMQQLAVCIPGEDISEVSQVV